MVVASEGDPSNLSDAYFRKREITLWKYLIISTDIQWIAHPKVKPVTFGEMNPILLLG